MTRRRGHDPVHTFRAPDALVAEVRRAAEESGESVSDIVRRALENYLRERQDATR